MDLAGKNITITGANRGIGWSLAKESAKRKAHLSLVVRNKSSLTGEMLGELKALGSPSVQTFELDLLKIDEITKFVESFWRSHQTDVLINNAGLLTGGLLENQNPNKIIDLIQVNITALTLLTQGFLPYFLRQGVGKIVNNASVMGEMCFPASSVYAASKAYVIGFTESLRQELKGTGVSTVLMYTPGVKTDMFDDIFELYGGHLDLDFLSSIPAEDWSKRVLDGIESGKTEIRPSGTTGFGLMMSKNFPKIFESLVASKFRR